MSAARVTVSVKFATIWPVVEIAGVIERAAEPAGAEPERAAGENPGDCRRLDHAAVGDGERSDQGTAAAAAVTDGKPGRCRSGASRCRSPARGRAVVIVADEGDIGINDAAVGYRQPSGSPTGAAAADREAESADIPLRSRSGHRRPSKLGPRANRPRLQPWLLSTPPLLMVSAPGPPKTPTACQSAC